MTQYLLDTNAVIAILNQQPPCVAKRLRSESTQDVFISSIVRHELFYGAHKSQRTQRNVALISALQFSILYFDDQDAQEAGLIRADLAKAGTPIGPYDVLIAGQARARQLTLVTHNTAEFARVPGLALDDWALTL